MRNILSGRTSKTLTLSEALCLQQKLYGLKEALELWSSVTSKKSPNVYKSCPELISLEKLKIFTPLQKLPKNLRDLGKCNCCQRLWKVAQSSINHPIRSHCSGASVENWYWGRKFPSCFKTIFFTRPIHSLFFFISIFSIQLTVNNVKYKACRWLDLNLIIPLVWEATALPTGSQPLPQTF